MCQHSFCWVRNVILMTNFLDQCPIVFGTRSTSWPLSYWVWPWPPNPSACRARGHLETNRASCRKSPAGHQVLVCVQRGDAYKGRLSFWCTLASSKGYPPKNSLSLSLSQSLDVETCSLKTILTSTRDCQNHPLPTKHRSEALESLEKMPQNRDQNKRHSTCW